MNVIVSNKYQSMLANLEIDVIKRLDGEFDADELGGMFKNFFFQRMILDITALKNKFFIIILTIYFGYLVYWESFAVS